MKKHRVMWSASCNGTGVCRTCGTETKVADVGPRGGRHKVWRVMGQWVREVPLCVDVRVEAKR